MWPPLCRGRRPPEIICIYHVLIIATYTVLGMDCAQYLPANLCGGDRCGGGGVLMEAGSGKVWRRVSEGQAGAKREAGEMEIWR